MNRLISMSSLESYGGPYLFDSKTLNPEILQELDLIEAETAARDRVICAVCQEAVTSTAEQIHVQGQHVHYRSNPHGFSFRFACFQEAPGCVAYGPASHEHSWFSGYSWRLALCANCSEHLGWLFEGDIPFFGLILDRLVFEKSGLSD